MSVKTVAEIKELLASRMAGKTAGAGGTSLSITDGVTPVPIATLLDVVAEVAKDGQFTREDAPAVTAAVQEMFDTYVRPFDLPGVGIVLERVVDDLIYKMIPTLIEGLFDKFVAA